jgi:predicted TIM-barrel fold metal-dependent hydrolase
MRVIDGHVHLWPSGRPGFHARDVADLPFPAELDGSVEALLQQMNAHGVERAICVQSPWWRHDDRYLIEAAERYPERFTAVGCLPLLLREADIVAEADNIGRDGLQGVRIQVTGPGAVEIALSHQLDPLLRRACDAGLPVLLLSRDHRAYESYARIASAFDSLPLVIEHFGHVSASFGGDERSLARLLSLARHPNVHVKLAIHHQHSREPFPWRDVFPLQTRLIEEFGSERLLWGSNWPMKLPSPDYGQRLAAVRDHFPFRSELDLARILGGTAAKLWPPRSTRSMAPES